MSETSPGPAREGEVLPEPGSYSRWLVSACLAMGMRRADVEASEPSELWDVARHGLVTGRVAHPAAWGVPIPPGSMLADMLGRVRAA